jgi:predicted glutamine amidotransferase
MTRLFGCTCNEPHRVAQALEPVRSSLVARGPIARWGLGYVQAGEVLLRRHPRPTENVDFFKSVAELQSDYVIGCASADDGLGGNANTQPFRFRQWLFASEGSIDAFQDEVQPRLLEHIPDYLARNIAGKTSSEHVFHLMLSLLHDAGCLDDPNAALDDVRRALRDTLALVYSVMTEAGANRSPGNIFVTNSRAMFAVRLDQPIVVRGFKHPDRRRSDDRHFRAVLAMSAAAAPSEGFEEIPPNSVLTISRELKTEIHNLGT